MSFIVNTILFNMSSILLTNITTSIYNINNYIKDTNQNAIVVADFIREYDIQHKIKTITEFIDSIQHPNHNVLEEIESIKICINDITKQLKIIEQRLEYNKSIWLLSSIRSYGFENRIKELKILMKVLNDRFNMLVLIYKTNNQPKLTEITDDPNIYEWDDPPNTISEKSDQKEVQILGPIHNVYNPIDIPDDENFLP